MSCKAVCLSFASLPRRGVSIKRLSILTLSTNSNRLAQFFVLAAVLVSCSNIYSDSETISYTKTPDEELLLYNACGAQAVCIYARMFCFGSACNTKTIHEEISSFFRGSHIASVAASVGSICDDQYVSVKLTNLDVLGCLSGCQPFICLIELNTMSSSGHYVIVTSIERDNIYWTDTDGTKYRTAKEVFLAAWKSYDFALVAPVSCLDTCSHSVAEKSASSCTVKRRITDEI